MIRPLALRTRCARLLGIDVPNDRVQFAQGLLRRVETRLISLGRRRRDLHRRLIRALNAGDLDAVDCHAPRYGELTREYHSLISLLPAPRVPQASVVLSSWMLRDSFRYCTATPDEGMHFVIGFELDGALIGTSLASVEYAYRSPVRAEAVHADSHATFMDCAESSLRIVAILHAHPGSGPDANHPSSTDLRTHELWERSGPIVGGIWSRSGHLRFFTAGSPVATTVIGTHLENIDECNWKLRDEFVPTND